jgi:hypothetical protein
MTPRHLARFFCLIIFVLLTSMTVDAQAHQTTKTGASEPTPAAAPAPTARPALPRARIYLPLLHAGERPVGGIFWADRYNLAGGECTNLHWDVQNVISVYFNGSPVTGKETRQVCPARTTTYTLRVNSSAGTQDYCVTIVVQSGSHLPIEFSADAYQIRKGECTILRWRVTGASAVYLNNVGVAGESSQQVCPEANTTYELRVVGSDGTTTTKRVTISVVSADEPILHFWADQYTLAANACTVLSWNVQNVQEVYLDDQAVLGQGSKSVCPQPNQLYTLRVTDNAGDSIERYIKLFIGDPALAGPEVIAQGIVNDLIQAIDMDPGQPGDQPGYRLVIDGVNALFTGTPGWGQTAVVLGVPQSLIERGQAGPVDWPIHPGQQVEFRAMCDGPNCIVNAGQGSYLRLRSE